MMMMRRSLMFGLLMTIGTVWAMADALDAGQLVNGRWQLEGSQTNHIGTEEEHRYGYSYKRRWALREGTFSVDGNDYTETRVNGDVVEATYRRDDDVMTVRIRVLDRDTVEYTAKGENSAFGVFSVSAKGTRIKD